MVDYGEFSFCEPDLTVNGVDYRPGAQVLVKHSMSLVSRCSETYAGRAPKVPAVSPMSNPSNRVVTLGGGSQILRTVTKVLLSDVQLTTATDSM